MFHDWVGWVIQKICVDVTSKKKIFFWWCNLWHYFFEVGFNQLEVCRRVFVNAWTNQVFAVLILNFHQIYFSIWITFAKTFRYFEVYFFSIKKTRIPSSRWPFLVWWNATYFGIWNRELFFAASSAYVSAKTITLNFSFKKPRRSFNFSIFLFRLLIFK